MSISLVTLPAFTKSDNLAAIVLVLAPTALLICNLVALVLRLDRYVVICELTDVLIDIVVSLVDPKVELDLTTHRVTRQLYILYIKSLYLIRV
jgi:hypothetical protein